MKKLVMVLFIFLLACVCAPFMPQRFVSKFILFEELNLYSMSVLRCPSFGSTMCQILDRDLRAYILRVQMFVCNTHFDDWYQAVLFWIELAFLMIYHVGVYPRQGLDRVDLKKKITL